MTDDWRPTETEAESRTMLAALYRILEDARRYEQYAEVAQRAYDEELVASLENCEKRLADWLSGPGSCSRSGWPMAGYNR